MLRTTYADGLQNGIDQRLVALGVNPEYGLVVNPGFPLGTLNVSARTNFRDNQTVPQIDFNHTWVAGNLTLRSGFIVRRNYLNVANVTPAQPSYSFTGLVGTNGVFGAVAGQAQALAQYANVGVLFGNDGGPTTPLRGWRTTQQEYYTQADWRVRRDVTLNLGLRYSFNGVYSEVNGAVSNLYPTNPQGQVQYGEHTLRYGLESTQLLVPGRQKYYTPDLNDFQPRIGAAWNIGGKSRTIIRGSYGVFADRPYQVLFSDSVTNPPLAASGSQIDFPFVLSQGGSIPVVEGSVPSICALDPKIRDPLTQRVNVAVEQRIDSVTSVTAAYAGSFGRGLFFIDYPNAYGLVPQEARPDARFSNVTLMRNGSKSSYQSFQLYGTRRLSRGINFTAAYTLAQSKDNYGYDSFGPPTLINTGASFEPGFQGSPPQWTPRSLGSDWGPSVFDVRHTFTFSHVIDLPFGKGQRWLNSNNRLVNSFFGNWSLAGVGTLRSSLPVDLLLGYDAYDVGDYGFFSRPALLSGSLNDFYARGAGRTQHLVSADSASQQLGLPSFPSNPS